MTARDTTRELIELERRFWDAMRNKDAGAASRLTDESCIVVGAQGVSAVDPPTMAKLTAGGDWEIDRYVVDDGSAQVRFLGDDVALVAYTVKERLRVEGRPLHLEANDASVWVRRDGAWRCAMHTESIAGDAFGRDRNAME
jgi:hypothetical protein